MKKYYFIVMFLVISFLGGMSPLVYGGGELSAPVFSEEELRQMALHPPVVELREIPLKIMVLPIRGGEMVSTQYKEEKEEIVNFYNLYINIRIPSGSQPRTSTIIEKWIRNPALGDKIVYTWIFSSNFVARQDKPKMKIYFAIIVDVKGGGRRYDIVVPMTDETTNFLKDLQERVIKKLKKEGVKGPGEDNEGPKTEV